MPVPLPKSLQKTQTVAWVRYGMLRRDNSPYRTEMPIRLILKYTGSDYRELLSETIVNESASFHAGNLFLNSCSAESSRVAVAVPSSWSGT